MKLFNIKELFIFWTSFLFSFLLLHPQPILLPQRVLSFSFSQEQVPLPQPLHHHLQFFQIFSFQSPPHHLVALLQLPSFSFSQQQVLLLPQRLLLFSFCPSFFLPQLVFLLLFLNLSFSLKLLLFLLQELFYLFQEILLFQGVLQRVYPQQLKVCLVGKLSFLLFT